MAVLVQFQHRLDTSANWTSANPVLLAGEIGLDTTVGRVKIGDGTTAWNSLLYQHTRLLYGTGAPGAGIGADGDFYLSTALSIYGPKAAGAWPAGQTLLGTNGWSPVFGLVSNGSGGFVLQIVGWTGGTGTPPSSTNQFIGSAGIVGTAAAAQDIRGAAGASGTPGTNGTGVPVGGATGTYLRKQSGTNFDTIWGPVGAGEITLAMQVNAAANSMRGEFTGSAASPQDLPIAANQFPARASTGNVAAKSISDLGITWLGYTTAALQTAAINSATQTLAGLMSPGDKKVMDNLHYDAVADFGFVGNDSTDNITAWTTMIAALPVGARVFFPAGTYRTSAEFTIAVDKRITFFGAGRYNSIIKTTSVTANIFNITIPAWYNTFRDLGFQSSVTKTAGSAIVASSGSAVGTNSYQCWATGIQGIDLQGSQSGNLSVHNDWDISAVPNGMRGIRVNGAVINTMFHNITMNAGAATTSACLEVNQSGAVQVTACDWIMGTNVVLLNSTAGSGPQAVYITNCFFDQPQASCIRMIGTNTIGRVKLSSCGIATAVSGFFAIEVAGTGAGGVGTATALPAGISIMDCDIYHQAGGSTGAGIMINGAQDVNIANTRIAGYSGAGGAGIKAIASAGGVTKLRVNGCIIGPNSNLTIFNTDGINLSGTFGALSVTDNTCVGNTTAINDTSSMVAGASKNINNNPGAMGGIVAKATGGATVLTTVDTVVMSLPLPANSLTLGQMFTIDYVDTAAVTTVATCKVRAGTAGTTADTAVVTPTASATATTIVARYVVVVTAIGAGTTTFMVQGTLNGVANAVATLSAAFSSTVANFLTFSIASTTSTTRTVRGGVIASL